MCVILYIMYISLINHHMYINGSHNIYIYIYIYIIYIMGAVDYGGCDYGECDYGGFYGECDYGGCVSVRVWHMG